MFLSFSFSPALLTALFNDTTSRSYLQTGIRETCGEWVDLSPAVNAHPFHAATAIRDAGIDILVRRRRVCDGR